MNNIFQGIKNFGSACFWGTIGSPIALYQSDKVLSSKIPDLREPAQRVLTGAGIGLIGMVTTGVGVAVLKTIAVASLVGLIGGAACTGIGALCLVISIAIAYAIRARLNADPNANQVASKTESPTSSDVESEDLEIMTSSPEEDNTYLDDLARVDQEEGGEISNHNPYYD